jgi:hypothetical protein
MIGPTILEVFIKLTLSPINYQNFRNTLGGCVVLDSGIVVKFVSEARGALPEVRWLTPFCFFAIRLFM